jgi:hypothetical protein
VMANEAGNQRPRRLFTAVRCRCDDPLQRSRRPQDAGIHAEAGILAPEPWTTRLQLRDSAGFAPDFPHFSLTPSDETLCCAFSCRCTLPRGSEVVKDAPLAVMAASCTVLSMSPTWSGYVRVAGPGGVPDL